MIILTIKTDNPSAEIGLYKNQEKNKYIVWKAHYELAETIHQKLRELCEQANIKLNDIEGIVCFQGPGSYTGLRIGLSIGNAVSYGLNIPIVTAKGKSWIATGIKKLIKGRSDLPVLPSYGGKINATLPK
ncbi:MAG TPA: tRNA (adenosine(37)-N6)-threonylcarbamoyltransferase complex dimerization subunit type 1 TsaB [Candidatus Saccharimonadales bacterium]|jgi:tRNA threonylcarbamoyladenosine biosynthesis protein TsaB|nr:tRNA (adenosine(37)-N6)-threonylcarbamoyltransferase complex dimerization subunit type 1 TsaB [Candidatus Saccharimonadales bacterium]